MLRAFFLVSFLFTSLFADRSGPFISLGGGTSQFMNDDDFVKIKDDLTQVGKFNMGAYINENLSVELEFNYLGTFYTTFSTNTLFVVDVATLAHLPLLDDSLDLTLKFGAGELWWQESTQFEQSDTTSTLVTGLGAAYRFNDTWSMKLGVDIYHFSYRKTTSSPTIDLGVVSYYSSLEYQF